MATFDVNTQVRKVTATANGSNVDFDFNFQVNAVSDIEVFVDSVKQTSGFSIVDSSNVAGLNANGTGRVKFSSAPANLKTVSIKSVVPLGRTSVYTSGGNITATSLEADFDTIAMKIGDVSETANRALKAPVGDPDDVDMNMPAKASRLGKTLAFNATTGNPEAGPGIADVQTVANASADIQTVAHLQDGTTATNAVSTVAGISSNIQTVAGINQTNLASVAGKATEIGLLGTADAVSDMNTLGTTAIVADMNTLADISADITTLAHIEDGTDATDAIQAVATNISAVQGAAQAALDAASARDSAKAVVAAIGAALDNFDDRYLGTMADTVSATSSQTPTITTVNGSASITVSSASGLIIGMKVTSANIPAGTNVIGISGTTITLNNAATAAASGTASTFSAHGVIGAFNTSTDGPSTDNDGDTLVSGALYFNTTDNEMRVYDGANWIAASAAGTQAMNRYEYTVSGSPNATFGGSDDNSATLSYIQNNLLVIKDGVLLHHDDFTATNGTQVVLQSAAAVGSEIVIYAFKSFTVADTVSKSSGGAFTGAVTFAIANMNGTELKLDADADTSITADTDDQIDIKIGGADEYQLTATKLDIKGNELVLDADGDTSITADTDDQIDVKIAGADDFKFTANNFNILSGSTLTIDSGANITNNGTASGFGITGWTSNGTNNDLLPGSASAGIYLGVNSATASNLLDDYEEGTWTPNLRGESGTEPTYGNTIAARYVKIGSLVHVEARMRIATAAGNGMEITGFPFTSQGATIFHFAETAVFGVVGIMFTNGALTAGSGHAIFREGNGTSAWITGSYVQRSNGHYTIVGTYTTAS